ncbi:FtsK/SpoIIIE domain-containing protein [Staphylococcus saprophyticus]|uniref:FtsK/SpoIIIE domain-containing protein n=1 Tax=Staphylococcus saprophyticus TaxID=29385 RepID=UPI0034C6002C
MNNRTKLQKTSSLLALLSKIVVVLMILNAVFIFLLRPIIVYIVHILFDNDFIFKIYTIVKDAFSVLPDKLNNIIFGFIPEPHTNKWGEQLEHITSGMGMNLMFKLLILLIIFITLYGVTILFRKHQGEIAPYKNDREAKRLKKEIIKTTNSRFFDKSKSRGSKDAATWNVFKWVFNKKVREERNRYKGDRIAKRTIRHCLVLIQTTKEKGQPAPVKQYKVIFNNPDNMEAGDKVFSKIKDLHNKLIQFTKVTFDQYKQPKDRSIYTFEGSIEVADIEAKSISKRRNSNQGSAIDESQSATDAGSQNEGNFPLELLVDRSTKIEEQKEAAQEFAKDKILDLDEYFATTDVQADLSYYNVGNSSVAYYYKPRYSNVNRSKNKIQDDLIDVLKMSEIMVTKEADIIVINVGLPKKYWIDIDNRSTISKAMKNATDPLHTIFGIGVDNSIINYPISKAPHMIIAGSTGSGKSVGVNYILTSITYNSTPEDVEFGLIDPKMVEFTVYEDHPSNIVKPITNAEDAITFLKYVVYNMEDRYKAISKEKVRNIEGYNKKMRKKGKPIMKKMLVVIDEFADLIMVGGKDVEHQVTRITQMGRAAGIHLLLATQRPSVDVLTGVIKNNMITRLAYQVSSGIDSKTSLDEYGAETLKGQGDSLLKWLGQTPLIRMQGGFLEDEEVENVVSYMAENYEKNPHVDYKARVAREEGEDEDGELAAYQESVSSLNQSRMEFEQDKAQQPIEDNETKATESEKEAKKDEMKTVTLNPLDYINKPKNSNQIVDDKNPIEPTKSEDADLKPTKAKSSGNRRKTKEEMSEIDNLILNKAFENVEKRRKNRKNKV